MIRLERKVRFTREKPAKGKPPSLPRVPRVARLMALAIRFDQLIREGVVADQAELARLGYVSRARLTQIMNLLNLAPDIQEALLFLESPERGREGITERQLREISGEASWKKQRARVRHPTQATARQRANHSEQ